jgi:hypothetical protein
MVGPAKSRPFTTPPEDTAPPRAPCVARSAEPSPAARAFPFALRPQPGPPLALRPGLTLAQLSSCVSAGGAPPLPLPGAGTAAVLGRRGSGESGAGGGRNPRLSREFLRRAGGGQLSTGSTIGGRS